MVAGYLIDDDVEEEDGDDFEEGDDGDVESEDVEEDSYLN